MDKASSQYRVQAKAAILISSVLAFACAANPNGTGSSSSSGAVTEQNAVEASLQNVRMNFFYNNYYSLNLPNASGCAGDAKTYYDAIAMSGNTAATLQTSVINAAETIRPSFIKNVSVDVTDANSNVPSNQAFRCSYTTGANATNCATFDYGADNGISSNLAGSIFLVGGIATPSGQDLTASCSPASSFSTDTCLTSIFAFSLNSFPADAATDPPSALIPGLTSATQPISSWANLNSSSTYAGPLGISGASLTYDSGMKEVAIFGGSTIQTTVNGSTNIEAAPTDTTFIFNAQTQAWTNQLSSPVIAIGLEQVPEQDPTYGTFTLSKPASGRANFGYIALSGVSLTGMSTNGTVSAANVDHTDHIMIVAGQDSAGYEADTHKFNPTYAPEWVDALGSDTNSGISVANGGLAQYLDNYEVQIMHNQNPSSYMQPIYPAATPTPAAGTAFGMAPIYNNSSTTPGTSINTGYNLVMGGLDPRATGSGTFTESCDSVACALLRSSRFNNNESATANFIGLGNLPYAIGGTTELTPVQWKSYTAGSGVPFYGGSNLLPGFSLLNNDVVFFGGSNCLNYQIVGQTGCFFNNPGTYFRMTTNPIGSLTVPSNVGFTGVAPPQVAGMAAARGLDSVGGNQVIVGFGGMVGLGAMSDTSIYYLFNNGTAGSPAPKWVKTTTPLGGPAVVSNAAMVYSHVTGKFYLFGGFNSTSGGYSGDTWELSISNPGCAASGSATTCQFSWRQLDVVNGLSCFPSTCPIGRRSHRMVEANYNNATPWLEPSCTAGTPCSFGIFMEGGTANGTSLLSDRWMFDPTANDGNGLWQQMNEMPARTQAPMASVDYTDLKTSLTHHMAVLFGGETGLQNPSNAALPNSFIPATLGDTWIYDFDQSTWNRVNLLGAGYKGAGTFTTETQRRQAYDATAPSPAHISDLTPPPISGGIMVTRTFPNSTTTGQIPEVYLIGGRKKDGSYQPFTNVYKFCIASTGESFASGSLVPGSGCDSYDSVLNPNSLSPISIGASGYNGRWLRKVPTTVVDPVTGGVPSAFLGAGTYDPLDDKILVYGGLQAATASSYVTNGTNISSSVFEYSPPTTVAPEGSWTEALACPGTTPPTARYGHSLNYDSRNQALVSIGGFNANGSPLTATINQAGSANYTVPEVWQAVRSLNGPGATPCYTWTEMTTFSNSTADATQVPPALGFGFGAGIYIPSNSYNTGFYSTFDSSCAGSGPISTQGGGPNGLLAGGVYIDIDRTQLGPYENLVLNLTFIPLTQNNIGANGVSLTASDNAVFDVHLVSTGQTTDTLQAALQPRFLSYTDNPSFPEVIQNLSVLAPANGQIQQQQLFIPLASDPTVDRIRIERVSGTAILLDASIFRMGPGASQ
jgi:hypothetical protein